MPKYVVEVRRRVEYVAEFEFEAESAESAEDLLDTLVSGGSIEVAGKEVYLSHFVGDQDSPNQGAWENDGEEDEVEDLQEVEPRHPRRKPKRR